ncbi:MAG TPA: DMT family transporter [Anaerolineaceae bacterium]|nr:DMT family transporter [Anaerolineaceae bacterium]
MVERAELGYNGVNPLDGRHTLATSHDLRAIFAGLLATSIWGGMYVVSKVALDVIPPFGLLTLRLVLGAGVLLGVALLQRQPAPAWGQVWRLLGVGLLGYGVSLGFQFVGTKLSTAANGALVTSATPAFVLLFGAWLLREPITRGKALALALASLGVVVVIDPRGVRFDGALFWGNLALVAAALTWALYSVLVRLVTRQVDVLWTSLLAFLGGLLLTVPAAAWEGFALGWGAVTWPVVAGVFYLGVVSTALAMYLWNYAFARLEAGVAAMTFFAQPVVGVGLGAWLLHEPLGGGFFLGGMLILVGVWLATREA